MARSKSTFTIYCEYIPIRCLFLTLRTAPVRLADLAGKAVLHLLLLFLPRRRRLIDSNLSASFPALSADARWRIARRSIENLGRGISMFSRIPQLARDGFRNGVTVEGREHIEAAIRAGRGTLLLTAHYGCWEVTGAFVPTLFSKGGMVVRPLDNPKLDALITSVRTSGGGVVVPRRSMVREGLRILRQNGALGILIDQNFAGDGVFVDFFGRPAATTPILSLLARRTGAPIIPMHSVWNGRTLRIIFETPVPLSRDPDLLRAQTADTQRMTAVIEKWIRDDPGQWLWLHNRWKKRPAPADVVFTPRHVNAPAFVDEAAQYGG